MAFMCQARAYAGTRQAVVIVLETLFHICCSGEDVRACCELIKKKEIP